MAIINTNTISLTSPSTRTIAERKKFASLVDDFATFYWDGTDMFNEFGAFIINEKKGSLKFYNGASFKNEYSKPQFQNGYTNITGVTFDTQKITFQIGVYWISIEDYRILMNFLHPYKVAYLAFSFEKEYGYYCKLAEIKDSIRHVVGKETVSSNDAAANDGLNYSRLESSDKSGYRYYTELTLTFEVIGAQCAKQLAPYEITDNLTSQKIFDEEGRSDLDAPIIINIDNILFTDNAPSHTITIRAIAIYEKMVLTTLNTTQTVLMTNSTVLAQLQLKNIKNKFLSLIYDSEQGLFYWKNGEKEQILSLLSTNDTGERIVSSLSAMQFYWPGTLDHPELLGNRTELKIEVTVSPSANSGTVTYTFQKRTNVL